MQANLSAPQANLKLALWNAQSQATSSTDLYVKLQSFGLPEEVTSRLHELIEVTKKVAGKAFAIGKIVVIKIIEFIKAHPFLVTGASIAAAISIVIGGLVASVPILGQMLAPVVTTLGISLTVTGAIVGHKVDSYLNGMGQSVQEFNMEQTVHDFFEELMAVFNIMFSKTVVA